MGQHLVIWTDGACRGNGKANAIGGYGVVMEYGENKKELSDARRGVTNNQMELRAVIEALKSVKRKNLLCEVKTDSAYIVNCINQKWYVKWYNNGWITSAKKPVENRELWIELIDQIKTFPFIKFTHVRGHAGIEGNERCDWLANRAMDALELCER